MNETDLITTESQVGPRRTMARLVAAVGAKGMKIFARVNHAAGAESVGLSLRPTELLMFGAPEAGTALMQADQRMGIDLPLRALVWLDAQGRTQVSYVDPVALVHRRLGLDTAVEEQARKMSAGLAAIVASVTGPMTAEERLDEAIEETFPASDPPEVDCSRR
jgi:uncharacterized protein (DUF302 family)